MNTAKIDEQELVRSGLTLVAARALAIAIRELQQKVVELEGRIAALEP